MTDKYKGIVELEINGDKIGFKFGTRSMLLFCEMEGGIDLKESDARLKSGGVKTALNFYYCAARAYALLKKTTEPTFDELCAWVDEYGMSKLDEESSKSISSPNSEAPLMAGQKQA